MADSFSSEQRSRNMRAVKARDTKPEVSVRRLVHSLGYRFRLYRRDLPGTPDLAFIGKRKAIFVHGCFWHRHKYCPRGSVPQSNTEFWLAKLDKNVKRDARAIKELRSSGASFEMLFSSAVCDRSASVV
jgi:DNA mismatch endonuclease (patch repair protein)